MKRLLSPLILGLVALIFAISAFADIARPKISPSPQKQGRTVFHTGLTIVTDPNSNEARLQISEESWRNLQQAVGNASPNGSVLQRISHSSVSTIMAGIFLCLSVSFVGIWLARSGVRRSHKAAAFVVLAATVFGAATTLTRANAGPPGYYRWRSLSDNLTKGQETSGGLDIEIVPGDAYMKLIIPVRKTNNPGE